MLGISGCVSMEFPDGDPAEARAAGAGLSLEQRWHLRNAAKTGEHELVATVGRMAWDNPQQAGDLGNYASALLPDSVPQIQDVVARTVR
jgi:hypothetical protein